MSKKPNVLWILTDQQPGYMLSCNGDPNVHTPNIDLLAQLGVNFPNAVSVCPLCSPARGTMLTSVYTHKCVPGHEYRLPENLPTIAKPFKDAGYHTAYIGKWHVDGFHETEGRAAMHIIPPERRGGFDYWAAYENNAAHFDSWVHGGEGENAFHYRLDGFDTDGLTDLLLNYLDKQNGDQPFFAVLSVMPPHDPYYAPEKYAGRFNPQQLKLRPNVPVIADVEETARQELAGSYAMIENMDDNVGRILAKLREKGLDEDTIILYFSDHGDMHGSHGQYRKMTAYQESVNVPLIISGSPNIYTHAFGVRAPYLVSHVDLGPTTLGLCGIPVPDWMEGTDYSGLYTKQPGEYPDSAFIESVVPTGHRNSVDKPWRCVVTLDGWKYACFENCSWMMYDLNRDPYEQQNMVHNPKFKEKRHQLQAELRKWIEKTGDCFAVPQD